MLPAYDQDSCCGSCYFELLIAVRSDRWTSQPSTSLFHWGPAEQLCEWRPRDRVLSCLGGPSLVLWCSCSFRLIYPSGPSWSWFPNQFKVAPAPFELLISCFTSVNSRLACSPRGRGGGIQALLFTLIFTSRDYLQNPVRWGISTQVNWCPCSLEILAACSYCS